MRVPATSERLEDLRARLADYDRIIGDFTEARYAVWREYADEYQRLTGSTPQRESA